ncbi:MAG: metallophosphoesterase [Chthoniobacterales bacterium]
MSAFLAILGLLIVLDLVWWRLSHRWLRGKTHWRVFNAVFLLAQILGFGFLITGRVAGIRWNLPTPWMASIYLWHLLILPLLLVIGIVALPVLLFVFWKRRKSPRVGLHSTETPVVQTRRQFLLTAAVVAPPLVNIALTGFSQGQLEQFRVREMTLRLADLPPALDGVTICHVTDLHVGPFTSERVIRRVVDKVNSLRADLVLFTGDLINSKLRELPVGIDFLRALDGPVVSIEGNHDLFEGRAAFENAVRAAGLRLLINEAEVLPVRGVPVQLLGLRWGGPGENARASGDDLIGESMRELLTLRDPAAFPILLAHHPHAFDPAIAARLPLTLSGHTHGGQLMLNPQVGAGPLMFRYWSGHYQRGASQMVVGNGVGNWFPLRTAAPAEIIHLTLRRQA